MSRIPAASLPLMLVLAASAAAEEPFDPPRPELPGRDCPHKLTMLSDACEMDHLRLCGGPLHLQHIATHDADGKLAQEESYYGGLVFLAGRYEDEDVVVVQEARDLAPLFDGSAVRPAVITHFDITRAKDKSLSVEAGRRVIQPGEARKISFDGADLDVLAFSETAEFASKASHTATMIWSMKDGVLLSVDGVEAPGGEPFGVSFLKIIRPGEPGFEAKTLPDGIACTPKDAG